jgi:DTW domain-containing protein YfiP
MDVDHRGYTGGVVMKQKCVWSEASTNPFTKKGEMPDACRKRGCDGFQKEPLCEAFIPRQMELQLLMNTNESKFSSSNEERKPIGCVRP